MKLFIRGSNKKTRDLVDSAARNFAYRLFGDRLVKNITINVNLSRSLLSRTGHYGEIWVEDEDERRYPREFSINLDDTIPLKGMLETLAHEMVHAKQYARGELKELWTMAKTRFHSVRYDVGDMDYWDMPWEIEAHGRERGLFMHWIRDEELTTEKWTFDFQ
jgi:hypothetical protein